MDKDLIKQVVELVCTVCGKEKTEVLENAWMLGIGQRSEDEIKLALKYYCQHAKDSFMPTPSSFMSYLRFDDPNGNKAAKKKKEETMKMLYGGNE